MDDTPVKVLTPSRRVKGLGKGVKEGRIWTYVRDDRPWASSSEAVGRTKSGSAAPPGVAYYFSTDRKGEHPQKHLAAFKGILQGEEEKADSPGDCLPDERLCRVQSALCTGQGGQYYCP